MQRILLLHFPFFKGFTLFALLEPLRNQQRKRNKTLNFGKNVSSYSLIVFFIASNMYDICARKKGQFYEKTAINDE